MQLDTTREVSRRTNYAIAEIRNVARVLGLMLGHCHPTGLHRRALCGIGHVNNEGLGSRGRRGWLEEGSGARVHSTASWLLEAVRRVLPLLQSLGGDAGF